MKVTVITKTRNKRHHYLLYHLHDQQDLILYRFYATILLVSKIEHESKHNPDNLTEITSLSYELEESCNE